MPERYRPPYIAAVAAAAAAFLLYVVTLAPTTAFWDASEYIATAHILGIPHPPGNPLFVVVGRVWSVLLAPLGLPVAVRINLLAAATSGAATGFLYLVAHRVIKGYAERELVALVGAGAAALLGATAFTVWNQSNVNEKVYTLSVLVIALVTWLAIRWRDERGRPGSERYLLWIVFLLALGSTNHLMSVLPAPALLLLVVVSGVRPLLRRAFIQRAVLLVVLGLSFNFVLPVRAELDPVINEGDPTCESVGGAAAAIYTHGWVGCEMLADNLTRRQYQPPPVTERKAPLGAQLEMWWQYFEWQWARGLEPSPLPWGPRLPLAVLFLALGGVGLWTAWSADRVLFGYLAVLAATLTLGLVYYLNFRYGYSLAPDITDRAQHEVRERDYFFIGGFMLWGVLAGIGLARVWRVVAGVVGGPRPRFGVAAPVLAFAVLPLVLNWSWASRSGDYAARDWAYDLLVSVEPYAVLFTNGDNDTFPLWYLQEVEAIRPDVTVVVGQYLYTDWYPEQLQELTAPARQRAFDPQVAPGLYEDRPPPERSILDLPPEELDGVGRASLTNDMTVPFPGMAVTYPAGTTLDRSHQIALSIIHDAIGERPIYFSAAGGMMRQLGLERWAVRQGLVSKLVFRQLEEEPPEGLVRGRESYGGEWFDLDRSLTLYRDVYRFRGIRDRAIWQDRSTLNIPWQYYALAVQLADVAESAGRDEALVAELEEDAAAFRLVAEGGRLGTPPVTGGP
ncbi:MAG: DUF2723 domain-containing protein [Gemmatimonadota bacterium]|nr:DUF2723 domain-containing protein [Gemmatimonadota bacterium]